MSAGAPSPSQLLSCSTKAAGSYAGYTLEPQTLPTSQNPWGWVAGIIRWSQCTAVILNHWSGWNPWMDRHSNSLDPGKRAELCWGGTARKGARLWGHPPRILSDLWWTLGFCIQLSFPKWEIRSVHRGCAWRIWKEFREEKQRWLKKGTMGPLTRHERKQNGSAWKAERRSQHF